MVTNSDFLKSLNAELRAAILLIAHVSDFDIKIMSGKIETMKKAENNTVTTVSVGISNALSGGRADFNSKRMLSSIAKAEKMQGYPKNVKMKQSPAKGIQLFIEKVKEENVNHN